MGKKQKYCLGRLTVYTQRSKPLPYKVEFGNVSMATHRRGPHKGTLYSCPYGRDFDITDTFKGDLFNLISKASARDGRNQQGKAILLIEPYTLMVFILKGVIPIELCRKSCSQGKYGEAFTFHDILLEYDDQTITFDIMVHGYQPRCTIKASAEAKAEGYVYFDIEEGYTILAE